MLLGRAISRTALLSIAPSIADDTLLHVRSRKLSHGQRKRLHLLAALASGARYLVFDEALNGVDSATVATLSDALNRRPANQTVLFTGHHEETYDTLGVRRIDIVDRHLVAMDDLTHGVTA
jgi:ABC-type multidrug transport system ATPase subunit